MNSYGVVYMTYSRATNLFRRETTGIHYPITFVIM